MTGHAGIIDDIYGADFVNGGKDGNIQDQNGHGTFVAGVVGAMTNNGLGVAGINQVRSAPNRCISPEESTYGLLGDIALPDLRVQNSVGRRDLRGDASASMSRKEFLDLSDQVDCPWYEQAVAESCACGAVCPAGGLSIHGCDGEWVGLGCDPVL